MAILGSECSAMEADQASGSPFLARVRADAVPFMLGKSGERSERQTGRADRKMKKQTPTEQFVPFADAWRTVFKLSSTAGRRSAPAFLSFWRSPVVGRISRKHQRARAKAFFRTSGALCHCQDTASRSPGSTSMRTGNGRRRRASGETTSWFCPRLRTGPLAHLRGAAGRGAVRTGRVKPQPWRRASPAAGARPTVVASSHQHTPKQEKKLPLRDKLLSHSEGV